MSSEINFRSIEEKLIQWQKSKEERALYQFSHAGEKITVAFFKEKAFYGAEAAQNLSTYPPLVCVVSLDPKVYQKFDTHFNKEDSDLVQEVHQYKKIYFKLKFFRTLDSMQEILDKNFQDYKKNIDPPLRIKWSELLPFKLSWLLFLNRLTRN